MASQQTVLDYIGRALWDPKPTKSDRQARQLAEALGYPQGWRVVRTLEEFTLPANTPVTVTEAAVESTVKQEAIVKGTSATDAAAQSAAKDDPTNQAAVEEAEPATVAASLPPSEPTKIDCSQQALAGASIVESAQAVETAVATDQGDETTQESTSVDADSKAVESLPSAPKDDMPQANPIIEGSTIETADEKMDDVEDAKLSDNAVVESNADAKADDSQPSTSNQQQETPVTAMKTYTCIVDRIYTGDPETDCDMFYHHEAAMEAAKSWNAETSTPFDFAGGHLLARQPLFQKGDKVQVLYNDEWWEATILRRTSHPVHGFKYQVHYSDRSKQSGVDERLIRPRVTGKDPRLTAAELGLGEGWTAVATGNNKWKISSPEGDTYSSKKKALEAYQQSIVQSSSGDPPWRTTDNEYLGRKVFWTTTHKVSARRNVVVEQVGTVAGWISETDVDKAGEPGFVSERTGKPARLFHVVFPEDPHHQYASLLIQTQDLEEYELLECLMDDATVPAAAPEPAKKKAKTR